MFWLCFFIKLWFYYCMIELAEFIYFREDADFVEDLWNEKLVDVLSFFFLVYSVSHSLKRLAVNLRFRLCEYNCCLFFFKLRRFKSKEI